MTSEDTFAELMKSARRSNFLETADALEHFADHEQTEFGPMYNVHETPHFQPTEARRLLWAFRAGRLHERGIDDE